MSGDGFLSRWSRRKREEARAADAAPPPEDVALPQPAPEAEPADAPAAGAPETLTEEELAALPPIETIDATTDISGYLRKGVPAALKNAALRRVWSASPAIRDYLDPAREYAYDWNVPGGVPGDGPLAPDFDAKALADRIFARHQTKVEDPVEPIGNVQDPRGDSSQEGAGNSAVAKAQPTEAGEPVGGAADGPENDLGESSAAHGFAEEARPSGGETPTGSASETTPETRVFRPRPRRHGRATPV